MENIIYNELLRRGYSVDVGVVTDRTRGANVQKEIDFVVNDADKKIYIQSKKMTRMKCPKNMFKMWKHEDYYSHLDILYICS